MGSTSVKVPWIIPCSLISPLKTGGQGRGKKTKKKHPSTFNFVEFWKKEV